MTETLSRTAPWRFSLATAVLLACHAGFSLAQEPAEVPASTEAASPESSEGPTPAGPAETSTANAPAAAADSASSPDSSRESTPDGLEQVVVSGEQPGPGLWKVTHGAHVLWVVSSVSPAPKDMKWRSGEVEAIVARSKVVVGSSFNVSPNLGIFRGLRYLPAVLRARFNPDKALLKDLISPDNYARWLVLRKEYFKDDDDIEKLRPMLIGLALYSKAIQKAGLTERGLVVPVVLGVARKNRVPAKTSDIKVDVDNPKQLIKDFTETPRETDLACFLGALDHLDEEIGFMKLRANAWAVGDIEAFRKAPKPAQHDACIKAVTSAPGLQDEFGNVMERMEALLMASVESALAMHDVSVMLMPLDAILREDGALSKLRARGYTVESP